MRAIDYISRSEMIDGLHVIESRACTRETDIYWFKERRFVVVGSLVHFRYRLAFAQFRRDVAADFDRALDALAERVGVDR